MREQNPPEISIRPEEPGDRQAVFGVNARAFETDAEARLVDALRLTVGSCVSLVALAGGRVVGHALFTPVTIDGPDGRHREPRRKVGADIIRYIGLNPSEAKYSSFSRSSSSFSALR